MAKCNNISTLQGGVVVENVRHDCVLATIKKLRKNLAFTLAEVLITLGIIGVVAAMVIPSLINSYQKKINIIKLKKAYSEFVSAVKLSEVQNGDLAGWDFNLSSTDFTEKYLFAYWRLKKDTANKVKNKLRYKTLFGDFLRDNDLVSGSKTNVYTIPSGATLFIDSYKHPDNKYFSIDINGDSGPNISGKDYFHFCLSRDLGVIPQWYGKSESVLKDKCYNTDNSSGCGALIMYNDWELPKDYPW